MSDPKIAKEQFNKHVNIFITEKRNRKFEKLVFGLDELPAPVLHYKGDPWLSAILRDIGLFKSTSEARGAGWHKKADNGFSDDIYHIKGRPHRITILKETQ